ncbi:MAG: OsmC family protein [Phycisphaerales bacterium]|jgi:putative redox protein|nr:OsmC family protein [Phycisphaerales bacterium]
MVESTISYQGQLRCIATHGPSGSKIETDAPVDNMGKGEKFSPTDLVGAALGSCILTIMGIVAQKHNLDLTGTTCQVQKEMVSTPMRRIGRLAVTVNVPVKLSGDDQRRLENAARNCPVHRSLHPSIESPIVFQWAR